MLTRKLKNYEWRLEGNQLSIVDKRNKKEITLDKVRFMSLAKFILNCLDKMRLESIKRLKEKFKVFKDNIRERIAKKRQK